MNINQEVQLPSDYLLENRNTLERLNGFDEMCEELDALQHEAMQYAFQDGVTIGEVKVLRQFVNGYKFVVTWSYESVAECKTEVCASDLIKC